MRQFITAAVLLALAVGPAAAQVTKPIKIDTGEVTGILANGVESFKGIPFAAPPVGKLRWRAPQPAAPWQGVKAADKFGFICPQLPRPAGFGPEVKLSDMSEDCLTINVYRPAGVRGKIPVIVWIYGGGLTAGASSLPTYSGDAFVRNGVMLVSFNYRLGRLGVFAHPALTAENADGGKLGNYLLMDQIAALQWVKRNIAAFGGDPDNVTIFGESAGGLSVNALMTSPEARGLFHRAISESGYGRGAYARMSEVSWDGKPSAETTGQNLLADAGYQGDDLDAMRAIPPQKLIEATKDAMTFMLVLDGKYITDDMWAVFRAGKEAPVPFMLGANSQEGPTLDNTDKPQLRALFSAADEAKLEAAYGGRTGLLEHVSPDVTFGQQARALARFHLKNGYPTYLYLFDVLPPGATPDVKGARHAAEVRYVFDTLNAGLTPITETSHLAIAKSMNAAWSAFAARKEPTGPGLAPWPRYDGMHVMHITNKGMAMAPDPRNPRLDALSALIDPKS